MNYRHRKIDAAKKEFSVTWDWWNNAENCRAKISADASLNGKLNVKINVSDLAYVKVFFQPNLESAFDN